MSQTSRPTACLALADGTLFYGRGFGATGQAQAELCFNTAMTGYQEIMTDPSYAGQIVTFTFPHVGNVGVNPDDDETADPVAAGMVVKWDPTEPSNWRAQMTLPEYLAAQTVLFYLDVRSEVRTRHSLEDALASGKRIVVPYCVEGEVLELFQLAALDELSLGMYRPSGR